MSNIYENLDFRAVPCRAKTFRAGSFRSVPKKNVVPCPPCRAKTSVPCRAGNITVNVELELCLVVKDQKCQNDVSLMVDQQQIVLTIWNITCNCVML